MRLSRAKITFWLDDVCSDDLGIVVRDFPTFTGAEQRVTKYSIPGRNGDLTYWDGAFENVNCEIKCFIASADKIDAAVTAVNGWLSSGGYKKFVISSEIGRYRMARITNAAEVAIQMGVLAPFTIKLDCKPQRFFDDENPVTLPSAGGMIYNPTQFTSLPVLRCFLRSDKTWLWEEITVTNSSGTSALRMYTVDAVNAAEWIDIDFESKTAKNNLGVNIPVAMFDAAGFAPGENTIATVKDAWYTGFEILPRWWTL